MNKRTAKKIAYRRAWGILRSTLASGWDPNELGDYEYSDRECGLILNAIEEICSNLWMRSSGNIESELLFNKFIETEDKDSLEQEIIEAKENIKTGHRVDGPCACENCKKIWLNIDNNC